jgi:hypothetical protein
MNEWNESQLHLHEMDLHSYRNVDTISENILLYEYFLFAWKLIWKVK